MKCTLCSISCIAGRNSPSKIAEGVQQGQVPQLYNGHGAMKHPPESPLTVQHVPILNSWSSQCERAEQVVIPFIALLSVWIFTQRLCMALVYFQNAWEGG